MAHALIIDDNIAICRAIRCCLEPLGFASFDQTRTRQQALEAAARRRPDIIVIGDDIEAGSAFEAVCQIASGDSIPVLMVSGDPTRRADLLERASRYDGPFHLNQIDAAVRIALTREAVH